MESMVNRASIMNHVSGCRRGSGQTRAVGRHGGGLFQPACQKGFAAFLGRQRGFLLSPGNGVWRPAHTVVWAVLVALIWSGVAGAQVPGIGAPELGFRSDDDPLAPPEPSDAMEAFGLVNEWVLDGGVAVDGEAQSDLRVWSAAIELRFEGELIGRGEAGASGSVGRDRVLRRAAFGAIREAVREIERRPAFAQRGLLWSDAAPEIRVSLELGGRSTPLTPEERDLAETERNFRVAGLSVPPGRAGVLARRGNVVAVRHPAWMVRRNLPAGRTLASLAGEVTDDPSIALDSLDSIAKLGVAFERFQVTRVAHAGDPLRATFLQRGGRVLDGSDVTPAALRTAGDGIVSNLRARLWPGSEPYGLRGTLDAGYDSFDTESADPFEQGIAADALFRYGDVTGNADATALATEIVLRLARVEAPEPDPAASAPSAAAFVLAVAPRARELTADADVADMFQRCRGTVGAAYSSEDGFAPGIPAPARSVIALAQVRVAAWAFRSFPNASFKSPAPVVAAVFRETPAEDMPAQAPFVAMASLELAELTGQPPAAAPLRDLRDQIMASRIGIRDVEVADHDLLGGVVFTKSSTGGLPTWQSARAAALTGAMLRHPALTRADPEAGEIGPMLVDQIDAMRFVCQLTVRETELASCAGAERAAWGVRSNLWTLRMPVGASAAALSAIAETLDSLDVINGR